MAAKSQPDVEAQLRKAHANVRGRKLFTGTVTSESESPDPIQREVDRATQKARKAMSGRR